MKMAKLVALYRIPQDAEAFDDYYFSTHVPTAKKLPGLRRYEVSAGPVTTREGDPPYHLAAILSFDSLAAIQEALNSPEGKLGRTQLLDSKVRGCGSRKLCASRFAR
jgi:uncharacterized protein (TIGR02118 family)